MATKPTYEQLEQKVRRLEEGAVEHNLIQAVLQEEKDKAQRYLDIAGVIMVAISTEGEVTLINRKGCEVLGYKQEEILKKNWFDNFLPERVRDEVKEVSRMLLAEQVEPAEYFENPVLTKNGQERIILWHNTVLKDGADNIVGHLSSGSDITERKRVAEALSESEEKYRLLVETMNDGLGVQDEKGLITYVNDRFSEIVGFKKDVLIGNRVSDFLDRKNKNILERQVSTRRDGQSGTYDLRWTRKDGQKVFTIMSAKPILDSESNFKGSFAVITDITERKRAEEALKETNERLRAKTRSLDELNSALKVLLDRREKDKEAVEENIVSNVKELIAPYVETLRNTKLDTRQMAYVDIIESNLKEIVSPFLQKLASKYFGLTPKEIQIAGLIKQGKTTKEIAELFNISSRTIKFHRQNIRAKLGLKNQRTNLASYLLSLP